MQKQLSPATAIVVVLIVVIIVVVVGWFVFLKPKKNSNAMSPDEMKAQMEQMKSGSMMPGAPGGGATPPGAAAPSGGDTSGAAPAPDAGAAPAETPKEGGATAPQ